MTENHCDNCGSALTGNALGGLCPRCLMLRGLASDTPDSAPVTLTETQAPGAGNSADGFGSVLTQLGTSLGPLRPVLLKHAEGDTSLVVKPNSDAMPTKSEAGDRYQISGEIARGGMGAVLRGRDVDLGRDLAVKVLLEKFADRPEVARAGLDQGEAEARLSKRVVDRVTELTERCETADSDNRLQAHVEAARDRLRDFDDPKRADAEYAAAFARAGLDIDSVEPSDAVAWSRRRSEPRVLAIWLDEWANLRRLGNRPKPEWQRLIQAAREADPDPWRDALRVKVGSNDEAASLAFRQNRTFSIRNHTELPSIGFRCTTAGKVRCGIELTGPRRRSGS